MQVFPTLDCFLGCLYISLTSPHPTFLPTFSFCEPFKFLAFQVLSLSSLEFLRPKKQDQVAQIGVRGGVKVIRAMPERKRFF